MSEARWSNLVPPSCPYLPDHLIMHKMILSRWSLVFVLSLAYRALHAQSFNDVAFSVGSYDQKTEEVRTVGAGDIWIVEDMDDGTSLVVIRRSYGLSVTKNNGVIFIQSVNLNDESSGLMLIGSLPIKIPSYPAGSYVQFTCEKGKFIYLYNRTK